MKITILQTARLFLRNLAFASSEDELRELFERHGEVTQVSLVSSYMTAFRGWSKNG